MAKQKGTVVLTGANGGLGSAIVRQMAESTELSSNNYGVFLVRNPNSASNLKTALQRAPADFGHRVMPIDLAQLSSVKEAAQNINTLVADGYLPPIHTIIINAGFQEHTTQEFSPDGFDSTFQINFLSHFLLVLSLLQSLDKEHGRIIIIGSQGHDVEDLRNKEWFFKGGYETMFNNTESLAKGTWSSPQDDSSWLAGFRRYCASQLCKVMFIHELQKRLNNDPVLSKVSVLGVDPGALGGHLTRRGSAIIRFVSLVVYPTLGPIFVRLWPNGTLRTPTKSARDVWFAASDTETLGDYPKDVYLNGSLPWPTSKESLQEEKRKQLWEDSTRYAGIVEGDTILKEWK
ncbi:hypothetical protein BX600DRAFT_503468 [Xylariales sp. PMI_506]|nr:hypothetical protein BX600DRAFT_503468 [Xylariales sp. PMI_506]